MNFTWRDSAQAESLCPFKWMLAPASPNLISCSSDYDVILLDITPRAAGCRLQLQSSVAVAIVGHGRATPAPQACAAAQHRRFPDGSCVPPCSAVSPSVAGASSAWRCARALVERLTSWTATGTRQLHARRVLHRSESALRRQSEPTAGRQRPLRKRARRARVAARRIRPAEGIPL